MTTLLLSAFRFNSLKWSAAAAGLLGAACSSGGDDDTNSTPGAAVEAISHSRAALSVATNTDTALTGLLNAASFLAESSAIAGTLNELGGGGECSDAVAAPCLPDGTCPTVSVESCESGEVTTADLEESRAELNDAIGELVEQLNTRFFPANNVEQEEEKAVIYLLGPEDLCGETTEASDGTESATLDAECADEVTRMQLRLRVTSPREGDVDVTVQMTEHRYEPMIFELHQSRLTVTADLDQVTATIAAMGEDLGGVEELVGRVQIELVQDSAQVYSLRYNLLDDFRLVATEDGERLEVTMKASSPAMELQVDGNAKTIAASYDYGAVRVSGPLGLFADAFEGSDASGDSAVASDGVGDAAPEIALEPEPAPRSYTGTIELLLGGLSGSFVFSGNDELFSFTNLGLGDQTSTVKHDGNTLLALDINKNQGRRFDVTVEDTSTGLELTFSPILDAELLVNFAHIADQFEVPDIFLSDTLRVWFDGESPTVQATEDGLRVNSGSLHLSSSAAPEHDLEVTAGMCLLEDQGDDITQAATDPLIGSNGDPLPTSQPAASTEEDEENAHPFSQLEVSSCE